MISKALALSALYGHETNDLCWRELWLAVLGENVREQLELVIDNLTSEKVTYAIFTDTHKYQVALSAENFKITDGWNVLLIHQYEVREYEL